MRAKFRSIGTAAGPALAIVLGCAVLVALTWTITLERISHERGEAVRDTVRQNKNLVIAFEEQTLRTIRGADRTVHFLRHVYQRHGDIMTPDSLANAGLIEDRAFVPNVLVTDASGQVLGASLNVADRDFFRVHRQDADAGLVISPPFTGRVTGKTVLAFSRRMSHADGSFAGVVSVGLDAEYFLNTYQTVDLGPHGLIELVGLDGIARVQRIGNETSFGRDMSASLLLTHARRTPVGSYVSAGAGSDGRMRFQSYRVLPGYPLVIAVGTTEAHALAAFRARERHYHVAAGVVTLLVALAAAGLLAMHVRRRKAEAASRATEARYRATFDQSPIGISYATVDGRFLRANPKFCDMLGYTEAELLQRHAREVTHPQDVRFDGEPLAALLAGKVSSLPQAEKRYLRKDGSALWAATTLSLVRDPEGRPDYVVAMAQDIDARKRAEEKLAYQAQHDALTGLPNRALFHDRLAQAINHARRHGWMVGAMVIDLDRFKSVNDTLGHDKGDLLLQAVAQRLVQCVRAGDTVARIGGDEFAAIATDLQRAQDAGPVAQKIVAALSRPFELDGREVYVGASVGVACFPLDGQDGAALLRNADAAMLRAKDLGRGNYQFYAAEMNQRAMEKLLLENDLRHALERAEFRLHLQPKASLADGRITGFEALLRWERPGHGLVPPGQFIPVLEDTGLIVPVGAWTLRAACACLRGWREAGLEPLPVAVNVSAKEFMQGDVLASVDAALRQNAVPAELLEVEITESDAMRNAERTIGVLRELKARGVRVAIDDFGTGYSSLSYLKRFPVDTLKLDRSFVKGLPEDADDVSIALAVITMAHSLELKVVAEGVETGGQRGFLASHGCDQMQGYLLSMPKPTDAWSGVLKQTGAAVSPAA